MIAASDTTTGIGHGKVILLGEHAVVFGLPALAAGLAATVRAHASPGAGTLSAPAWQLEAQVGDESLPGQAVARLLERLHVEPASLDFWLEAEVPARAGLGSSAAMAVAIARAVAARTGAGESEVQAAVAAAESVFHRAPSGIDAAAASRGCAGRFDKAGGWRDLPVASPFELCVGISGKGHDTGALVARVQALCEGTPVARKLIDAMGDLALAGMSALAAGDILALARLFDMAHGLLAGVGVSCRELDDMAHTAREAGAMGAKLTGAGGGGAVIAIAGEHGEEVLRRWRAKGSYGFITTIGHA
ncbi:MAG: mevalonate kinase [Deltaproteobacteria bacterium]|nr:mevalonate kinase [Deltaproteobacteria bacterium]